MPTIVSTPAQEGGTYKTIITCKDDDGNAVTPKTLTWTLTDYAGNVINERSNVSETPAASVPIVLSGDDLQVLSSETADTVKRLLTVSITYDSDAGSDLPQNQAMVFPLENLTAIT